MIRQLLALALALLAAGTGLAAAPQGTEARGALAPLAVPFEENAGQHDAQVAFSARIASGTAFVTRDGRLVHALHGDGSRPGWALVETFPGARLDPRGASPSSAGVTYIGPAGAAPRHARTWSTVSLGEPWPGIAVSLVAQGGHVEKLFTVAPGADASRIRVRIDGTRQLHVAEDGALVAENDARALRFTAPIAWQEFAGERRPVEVAYVAGSGEYGFRLGAHDPGAAVVIDPILQSAVFGSPLFDLATAVLREPAGTVLVAGSAGGAGFPGVAGGAQSTYVGALGNAVVTRLSADLTTIVQSTYFGGAASSAAGLAVDAAGAVYIAGRELTGSPPLLGTSGAAQPSPGGGANDAFVAKLAPDLRSVIRATYLGGTGSDGARALALDAAGNVVVAGETESQDFPGVATGAQAVAGSGGDAFVARLSGDLTTLVRATYLGGTFSDSAAALALDEAGNVYVAGETASPSLPGLAGAAQPAHGGGSRNAFVARLAPDLASVARSTYLGGSGSDRALALALAPSGGGVYVSGTAGSPNFPGTAGGAQAARNGSDDAFVARLGADLGSLAQATYLGGGGIFEEARGIAVDGNSVVVVGTTGSANFPGISGGAQPLLNGSRAGFAARLAGDLKSIVQSTFVSRGSSGSDATLGALVIEPAGTVLVAGSANGDVHVARITADLRALPPVGFVVTVGPLVARGGTLQVTVTARDANNQVAVGYSGTVRLTSSGAGATIVPATRALVRGEATFGVTFDTVGTHTLTAVDTGDGTLTGTAPVTVANVASIVLATPASTIAGVAFNGTVTAYDSLGNILPGAHLRFSSSAASAALPPDVLTTGTAATRTFMLMTAGEQTVTAADARQPGGASTSASITVIPAVTQRLGVSAPSQATAGAAFTVAVEAQDAFGNFTPGYAANVRLASSDSAATLPPEAALAGGRGNFTVTLNSAGTHTVVASAPAQPTVRGSAVVEVAPAVRFTITTPATATAGVPFDVTVSARAPDGSLLSGYAGTIRFSSSDAAATLPANATLPGGTGVFSVVLKTAGSRTIGVVDVANATHRGTSPAVSVGPAAAASLAVSAPTLALPGVAFQVSVTARDAFGNLATGNASTVRITSSDPAAALPAEAALVNGARSFPVTLNTNGSRTVTAADAAAALTPATSAAISVSSFGVSATSIDFGGQSMGTTSPPVDVTVLTADPSALTFTLPNAQFSQSNDCAAAAPSTPCTVRVRFSPAVAAGPLNATVPASATLTVASPAGSREVALAGVGEKSLVTHYYRAVLGRDPDAGGKAFWQGEAARVAGLGANLNETWFAMAMEFFSSAEYAAFGRDNRGFVADLYNTFFNRVPDPGGESFWVARLDAGLPRGVALAEFMFSAEFRNFSQAIFGNVTVRAELNMVMDFYRGLLARLPDNTGFDYWVQQFRTAQCQFGTNEVTNQAEAISSAFALAPEYAARSRSNAQYVGDLYNAFLRRGGDPTGVQFWIGELDSGARTREQVRINFRNSSEFQGRVFTVALQGCLR